MDETRLLRRLLLFASIIVVVSFVGGWFLIPTTARAASLSPGCTDMNLDRLDDFYQAAFQFDREFYEGEMIVVTAGPPWNFREPSTITLSIDRVAVGSTGFPGTVTYVFTSDVSSVDIHWTLDDANATWNVSCAEYVDELASAEKNTPHIPYTGIHLLAEDVAASFYAVPDAEGVFPCGVFDVNGWGRKYVGLTDFPACAAAVSVLCLTGDGAWTADTVGDVVMHGDWEVDFTSHQHGICGLFPQ